jgi:hypothetical protein
MNPDDQKKYGAVFQVTGKHPVETWVGALVFLIEWDELGMDGWFARSFTPDAGVLLRLKWDEVLYIGQPRWIPNREDIEAAQRGVKNV